MARALRGRRPARGDGPLPRLRARRGRGGRPRGRRAPGDRAPGRASTSRFELWRAYDNEGWPARYLWDADGHLAEYHYGEGGYAETELAIQELLGIEREPLGAAAPRGRPDGALIVAQTPDQPGAYSGPYEAGGVWAVLGGAGELRVNGERVAVDWPGARRLVEHAHHVEARARAAASATA